MNVYLAAFFSDKETVKKAAAQLEAMGHNITHKWYDIEADVAPPGPRWSWPIKPEWREMASNDLDGAIVADALVALIRKEGGTGVFVEIGAALSHNVPVILVPVEEVEKPEEQLPFPTRSIFDSLCTRAHWSKIGFVLDVLTPL